MKIYITAKPKSKKEYVKRIDGSHYIVAVKELPIDGRANRAIIKSLSDYFHKPGSEICIINGEKGKHKIIEIPITEDDLKTADIQQKMF